MFNPEAIKAFFSDQIPFHKFLGLEFVEVDQGRAVLALPMRPEFIGDPVKQILHGGLFATMLDVTGGLTAITMLDFAKETSLNTIDMRVDYIRMGRGARFTCEGNVIRKGNRIVVTRMELKDDAGKIIALGTGTYNIFNS